MIGIAKVSPLDIHYSYDLTFFEHPSAIHYETFVYLNIMMVTTFLWLIYLDTYITKET
jgi:hypothetical protein